MKPRRFGYGYGYGYGRVRRAAALLLLLLLCLCLSSLFLLLLHGSSTPLEPAAAAAAAEARVAEAQAEVEEAPLPPGNSKVAFLFIARNRLPLELVWDAFFRGDKEGRFSILVHSRPGFVLTRATTRSRFFYNRQVNDSIQVDWGEASMITAERILLSHALKDPLNDRFVFVSDSCVPLYNFSYTYDYIMSSSTSFVDRYHESISKYCGPSAPFRGGGAPFGIDVPFGPPGPDMLPTFVNWSTYGAVTPIQDQGDCGSCWAFGVTGLIEAAHFIRNKELIKLSEQHLIDGNNLRNFGCKHGSCSEALDYIMRNGGIINAESYPYKEAQEPVRFADTKAGRYNPRMDPVIPVENWRKGSQWAVLIKKHAEVVVDDEVVLPEFQKHCRRRPLPEFWRDWDRPIPAEAWKAHNCIPDEHYVQTLLAQSGLEEELTRRSVTHSAWDLSASKDRERRGWHPVTYKVSDATTRLIKSIKDIDNIYYETENRREWCTSNGKPAPCFLFARKFTRGAGLKLLDSSLIASK
ncbi:Core-2/I-branching beta-16-N-acetylglucosaminyltransferase family protein [Zea mays]|uniref:Core-2/I-branching beta-16-N-acetylglucosaminyltransferase family protein n=1 Tax=Zea mays TaxID=4577 RepID=A0A1D6FM56_MAIZE|nr:Core-2/I-branching beta-16-N-acetylglucosaminyltransferase family protein [Zea mays]